MRGSPASNSSILGCSTSAPSAGPTRCSTVPSRDACLDARCPRRPRLVRARRDHDVRARPRRGPGGPSRLGPEPPRSVGRARRGPWPSFRTSGADGAGVVDAIGDGVDDVALGDEVVIDPSTSCGACPACDRGDVPFCERFGIVGEHRRGTHADAVIVPAVNVRSKPAISWERAAKRARHLLGPAHAAPGPVRPGDDVLVVGVGGGTSTAAMLPASALGARQVGHPLATRPSPVGRPSWRDGRLPHVGPVRRAGPRGTDGRGVDIVVENVGTLTLDRPLRSSRGGRLVVNGSTTGRIAGLHLPTLFWRQLEVIGSTMNDHREFADALQLAASGAVEILSRHHFPFEDFPAALERRTPALSSARSCSPVERATAWSRARCRRGATLRRGAPRQARGTTCDHPRSPASHRLLPGSTLRRRGRTDRRPTRPQRCRRR